MNCTQCDQALPIDSFVCPLCEALDEKSSSRPLLSHKQLARAVRKLKGLVLLSVLFGLFVAPFAIWTAANAIRAFHDVSGADASQVKQLRLLQRLAWGLLIFWVALIFVKIRFLTDL
ncbi:MAG: hypothetical protein QOF63_2325 [Thermoanaerobaculia bacterium]|jgi:hypothetical protein|nr:hypothetical protein [Thermoanaerobaculia bacterium]